MQAQRQDSIESQARKHGLRADLSTRTNAGHGATVFLPIGIHKLVKGWGPTGIKRVLFEFTPKVEQALLERGSSAKGLDHLLVETHP
ncbi:uncharacterized protein BXZ73DRAFT_97458 [Epithele typhae]|uniref:uncharacterized protein n=1 Tax=Epithele typhae TaxID=378194 RepID=UPI002008C0C4|nr:uncharacterized protein BXZ73DRAFT_97458 [Epithele typhae]KAH9943416.1 hypothetical protein BXZ73DRAFT_97458 [Epithele typhae]